MDKKLTTGIFVLNFVCGCLAIAFRFLQWIRLETPFAIEPKFTMDNSRGTMVKDAAFWTALYVEMPNLPQFEALNCRGVLFELWAALAGRTGQVDFTDELNPDLSEMHKRWWGKMFPDILVVGGQSAGKSSLLEALTGFRWFPTSKGATTRCPVRVQVQYCHKQDEYGTIYARGAETNIRQFTFDVAGITELHRHIIELAANGGRNGGFSNNEVIIDLYYHNQLPITFVDTPGVVTAATPAVPDPDLVDDIVEKCISVGIKNDAIIVAAVGHKTGGRHTAVTDVVWPRLRKGCKAAGRLSGPDPKYFLIAYTKVDIALRSCSNGEYDELDEVFDVVTSKDAGQLSGGDRIAVAADPFANRNDPGMINGTIINRMQSRASEERKLIEIANQKAKDRPIEKNPENKSVALIGIEYPKY